RPPAPPRALVQPGRRPGRRRIAGHRPRLRLGLLRPGHEPEPPPPALSRYAFFLTGGGEARRDTWMGRAPASAKGKPEAAAEAAGSRGRGYLVGSRGAGARRGRPKRPSRTLKTISGRAMRRRPVSRTSTESGTGWGPATLKTPRTRLSSARVMAWATSRSCMN